MNLKLRNTLISVGALTLIGVATAGLVVSLQKQKTIKEKDYLSRHEIASVVSNAYQIINYPSIDQKTNDRYKELTDCLHSFYSLWFPLMPDEKDFDDFDSNLEPLFIKLQNLVDGLQGPTPLSSTRDIRDILGNAQDLLENPPANMPEALVKVWQSNLKEALKEFEKKWTDNYWPDQSKIAEIDKNDQNTKESEKLGKLFDNLKNVMVVTLMPYIENP